jgi:hypothetical protein
MGRLLLTMDKLPGDDATDQQKSQALTIYRKITVLRCVPCCGMCGQRSTRARSMTQTCGFPMEAR